MANKTDFKKITLKATMSTDGDFGFTLMPNCMRFDGDDEYEISWNFYPSYYDTNESVIEYVVNRLEFISNSLSEQIHGKDYVVPRIRDAIIENFDKIIELVKNASKTERYYNTMFTGNQEGDIDFLVVRNNDENPEKPFSFVLKENTYLELVSKMEKWGDKTLDAHLHTCWEYIDKYYKELMKYWAKE